MQGRQSPIVGLQGFCGRGQGLLVEVLCLVILPGCAQACGRVDQCGGPGLGAFDPHPCGQLDGPLNNPHVLLVPSLGAVEAHGLVEYGQEPGVVSGIFGIHQGLLEVRFGIVLGLACLEDGIQTVQEHLAVEFTVSLHMRCGVFPLMIVGLPVLDHVASLAFDDTANLAVRRAVLPF